MKPASAQFQLPIHGHGAPAPQQHSPPRRYAGGDTRAEAGDGYYDVPMLKRSPWKWEISTYFFFGGVSGGAFLLSRMAERFGGRRMSKVRSIGAAVAGLTVLPCAPLLIKDLGHMSRFHHMLRMFKPETPMSLGTWTLTTYSGAAALALLREVLRQDEVAHETRRRIRKWVRRDNPVLIAAIDGAGIPAALLMTTYTGVLLSCTATPIWTRNAWLPPLFTASAINTGAAAIQLGMACGARRDDAYDSGQQTLRRIASVARGAEALTLLGYLRSISTVPNTLMGGRESHHTLIAAAALVLPELVEYAARGKPSRWKLALAALITLAGGLSLRQGIVNAGNQSAEDPDAARYPGRREDSA